MLFDRGSKSGPAGGCGVDQVQLFGVQDLARILKLILRSPEHGGRVHHMWERESEQLARRKSPKTMVKILNRHRRFSHISGAPSLPLVQAPLLLHIASTMARYDLTRPAVLSRNSYLSPIYLSVRPRYSINVVGYLQFDGNKLLDLPNLIVYWSCGIQTRDDDFIRVRGWLPSRWFRFDWFECWRHFLVSVHGKKSSWRKLVHNDFGGKPSRVERQSDTQVTVRCRLNATGHSVRVCHVPLKLSGSNFESLKVVDANVVQVLSLLVMKG